MNYTDYKNEVLADAKQAIADNHSCYTDFEDMFDALWIDDSVTGNGSGSYTFSTYQAEKNVQAAIFDPDILAMFEAMDVDMLDTLKHGAEALDVSIRCFMLFDVEQKLSDYYAELLETEGQTVYRYRLIDSMCAPQCGANYTDFETWNDLQDYLDQDDDLAWRISEGYARIQEIY